MKLKLEKYIKNGTQVAAENKRLILQLQSLMDLQTTVPENAVLGVVTDEVNALRDALAGEMDGEVASGFVRELGEESDSKRPVDWLSKYPPSTHEAIGKAENRYRELEKRVSYLMRPTTYEEVQNLDPVKDCDQIYHFVSYEFRLEHRFYANLFEARPTVIPSGSLLFHSTGEFTLRSVQRITDTVLFFSNLLEWGMDSHRGSQTLGRLNGIHGRYSVGSDTFKFILANIMFVPGMWNEKLGWRPLSDVENLGWYHAFAKVGRAMNIRSIPDDREEMRQWWIDYCSRMADSTPIQRKTFDEIVLQVISIYPKPLRRFALNSLLTGMDDLYRNALGYPAPPLEVIAELKEVFRTVGYYSSLLPRIPWMRSLQTFPLGGNINRLGVSERSAYMPALDGSAPNRGYPQGQVPLGPEEGAQGIFAQLPVIFEEELKRHTETHSAWTAIQGVIYDLTPFLFEHPGGIKVLKPWLGRDATQAFEKIGHSPEARSLMLNFRIGRLPWAQNQGIPVTMPDGNKKRPGWTPQPAVSRQDWDQLLDSLLSVVDKYLEGTGQPTVQGQGPVAPFPVHLPSHARPQGVCPFPHGKSNAT